MVDRPPSNPPGRLLVVDDESDLLQALVAALETDGFDVTGCPSGTAALEVLRAGSFDVLLTDLMMPGLDGVSLLRAGRELDPNLVGLIMTGKGTLSTAVEALKLGVFDYLLKPFTLDAMLLSVNRALELRQVRLENVELREALALRDLSQAVSATFDMARVAELTADAARQQLRADQAAVFSLADGAAELVLAARTPAENGAAGVPLGARVPLNPRLAAWLATPGQPLRLDGPLDGSEYAGLFPWPANSRALAVHMLAGGRVQAVLVVAKGGTRRPFTPGQVTALGLLANAGAAALENALLMSQLQASELRYRELIEHATDGIVTISPHGDYLEANSVLLAWLGYTRAELLQLNTRQVVAESDHSQLQADLDLMRGGAPILAERRLRRKDGSLLQVELSGRQLPDGNYQAFMRDIAERKLAERALRESEARLAALFQASPAAITITTAVEGRFVDVNAEFERLLGYTRAEVIGRTVLEVGTWAEPARRELMLAQLEQHNAVHNVEQRFRRKSGEVLDVLLSIERIELTGEPYLVGLLLDITDRKHAEQALRDSEKRFAAMFQASPAAITLSSLDGRIVDVNQEFERSMGYARQEVVGRQARELNTWAMPEERDRILAQLLAQQGTLAGVEVHYRRKSGEIMVALVSYETVELAGQPYLLTLALDITGRKQAEDQLRENELRLQVALKGVNIAVFNQDRDLRYTWMYQAQLGYTTEQVLGHTDAELLPAEDLPHITALKRRVLETGQGAREEVMMHGPAGAQIFDLIVEPLLDRQGALVGLMGASLDITERRQTEDRLRFQAGLLAAVGQAVIATDAQNHIVYWNHMAESLYGWTAQEVLGQSTALLTPPDDDRARAREILAKVSAGQSWSGEYVVRRRDGTTFPAAVTDTPFYNGSGALAGVIGMSIDISERKQREREMEAIGQLSAALRAALSAEQIPPVILDQVQAILGATAASLNLLYPASHELKTELATGVWAHYTGARVPDDHGIAGQVVNTGRPYVTQTAASDPLLAPPEVAAGLSALAVQPLIAHGATIGTLSAGRLAPFTESDLRLFSSIADIAANALQRATLHEQTRLRAEQLAGVNDLARALAETLLLEQIYERLEAATRLLLPGVDSVTVSLYDAIQPRLTDVFHAELGQLVGAADPALAGEPALAEAQIQVAQTRLTVTVKHAGPRWTLLAPLLAKGQVTGVLRASRPSTGPDQTGFEADEARLLATVASTAAVAIENARLFAETQRRLQRLQALRTIDLAITSSMDSHISLRVLVDQAMTHLAVDAVDVLLLDPQTHRLELASSRGFKTPPPRFALRVDEGLAGRAFMERRMLHVPSLGSSPSHTVRDPWFAAEGFDTYFGMPLVAKGTVRGVLEVFQRAPLLPEDEWLGFLETLAEQAAIAVDNSLLFADLQRSKTDLELAYDTTLEGWSRALDLRDKETEGHTQRVTDVTERLARTMGLAETELVHMRRGGLLHDIGKMGIPDSILLKAGPLTDEEWVIMRRHPQYAYELLAPIAYLRPALDIPYCHHEKWDGSGYPRGLSSELIPLAARIFAVVDVWDALRSTRPYRAAWPEAQVREHIRQLSGSHFDPQVVEAFLGLSLTP